MLNATRPRTCVCYACTDKPAVTAVHAVPTNRPDRVKAEAAGVRATLKNAQQMQSSINKYMQLVLVEERQRLQATADVYSRIEDATREQACLAEHTGTGFQAAPQLQTLQTAVLTSQEPAALLMLSETIAAEVERARVHTQALRLRRLQMSLAMSEHHQLLQQCQLATHQPSAAAVTEEQQQLLYEAVMHRLEAVRACNKQLYASTIRHAATHTHRNKRRQHLIRAMKLQTDLKHLQQQSLEQELAQHMVSQSQVDAHRMRQRAEASDQLQAAIDAYEDIRLTRAEELELFSKASDEEAAVVLAFLGHLAAEAEESEARLSMLMQDVGSSDDAASALNHGC